MAPRIVSWSDNEICISPVLSSAASIVSFDSAFSDTWQMSPVASEAPGFPSADFGARHTSLPEFSEEGKTPRGGHAIPDDSFVRHDVYFFKDGNVTFLIDGTLYCVHRYFFSRDSVYFSTRFAQLGIRDHEALPTIISIGDVERNDFEALLSVLYPANFVAHELSYERWKSVLHLSTRWGFASLRQLALKSIKPPTPHDQLVLARTYSVDHWVLPALTALCERTTPLNLDEARQMNLEDVVLVATVREEIRGGVLRVDAADIPRHVEIAQAGEPNRLVGNNVYWDRPKSGTTGEESDPRMASAAAFPLAGAVLAERHAVGAMARQEAAKEETMRRLEAEAAKAWADAEEMVRKVQEEVARAKESADVEAKKAVIEAKKAEAMDEAEAKAEAAEAQQAKLEAAAKAKADEKQKAAKERLEIEAKSEAAAKAQAQVEEERLGQSKRVVAWKAESRQEKQVGEQIARQRTVDEAAIAAANASVSCSMTPACNSCETGSSWLKKILAEATSEADSESATVPMEEPVPKSTISKNLNPRCKGYGKNASSADMEPGPHRGAGGSRAPFQHTSTATPRGVSPVITPTESSPPESSRMSRFYGFTPRGRDS